ncbi:hypothetical protein KXV58_006892 [Aspergillus fumigatus]|nr:hypothetical protein KXX38_005902 [Aspergillus fumigatus]KAH2192033.1 hypothetical protein KXV88_007107 [Aspergillus fumigatus]KAH2214826.1 hypothetical protein KXV58_006892 [Aspergillus fumigatus]KAH2801846.1 hypothetical protein KXW38_006174 [Aspergillus fumigatus]KAH3613714.1 hypothetical protein KXV38_006564 [Aspergillus fumigatus]
MKDMSLAQLESLKLCQPGSDSGERRVKAGGVIYRVICDHVVEAEHAGLQLTTPKFEEALIMCSAIPNCGAVTIKEPGVTYAYWNPDRKVNTIRQPPGVIAVAIDGRSSGGAKINETPNYGQCPGIDNSIQTVGRVRFNITCTKYKNGLKNPYRTTGAMENIFECLSLCSYDPTCEVIAPSASLSGKCGMGRSGADLAQDKKGYDPDYWVAHRIGAVS